MTINIYLYYILLICLDYLFSHTKDINCILFQIDKYYILIFVLNNMIMKVVYVFYTLLVDMNERYFKCNWVIHLLV